MTQEALDEWYTKHSEKIVYYNSWDFNVVAFGFLHGIELGNFLKRAVDEKEIDMSKIGGKDVCTYKPLIRSSC
jgi:hypothetical protein